MEILRFKDTSDREHFINMGAIALVEPASQALQELGYQSVINLVNGKRVEMPQSVEELISVITGEPT